MGSQHPPALSSEEEGENRRGAMAPSSSEEGGGGGAFRPLMLARAARMRREPTEPERRLWMALRDSRLSGYKFRRQAVIGSRIADFFCPAKGLIVELDGETHDRGRDLRRDAIMERATGYATVRFTNRDIIENLEGVLVSLLASLGARQDRWGAAGCTTPQPPPLKRRGSLA